MRRAAAGFALVALALVAGESAGAQAPADSGNAVRGVHDPAVIKAGDTYWLYATGVGIPIRRSRDLVTWTHAGRVFDGLPAWAPAAVPGVRNPWAPDISFFNGRYHLYYSLSTFGSQRSAIGVATNVTLDPADARYRWVDQGLVVESRPGVSTHNAIDPNVVLDAQGVPWLSWGSFWGGLKMRRLDPATGKPSTADTTTYALAARTGTETTTGPNDAQSVEAPFVVRRGNAYYLFASYDMCCRGVRSTYHVRVGRAAAVTGPYVDRAGVPLTAGGGTVVLEGAGRVRGPGHNAVLSDGGRDYLVHHFYDELANGRPTLQIRPLTWTADGWPRAGEPIAPPPAPVPPSPPRTSP